MRSDRSKAMLSVDFETEEAKVKSYRLGFVKTQQDGHTDHGAERRLSLV